MNNKYTKESFEIYLDKIINKYRNDRWLVQDLLDIKERVIKQRCYKNMDQETITRRIVNRYAIAMYGIKEPPQNEKLYKIIRNIIDGAIDYEFLDSEQEG